MGAVLLLCAGPMRLSAIINSRSGSVPDDGAQQFERLLEEHGWPGEIHVPTGEGFLEGIETFCKNDCDAIVVWGGDGTVSTVMQMTGPSGPPIIPLPGGTMNMLHTRVHGAVADWQTCLVESILRRRPETIPGIMVGDRLVFVGALIGRLTGLARARETVREGAFADIPNSLNLSDNLDLTSAIRYRFDSSEQSGQGTATAVGLFVTEDRHKMQDGIDFVTTDPANLGELFRIGLQALTSPLPETEGVEVRDAERLSIEFENVSAMPGTLDGEPTEFQSGLTVRYVAEAAKIMGAGLA
ncbi:MAG: hypothetical protein CMK06_05315 [Ponticaulis sp.]|nr:hypothetical protein [Ponticaulis sp.]